MTYQSAGVSRETAEAAKETIKHLVHETFDASVLKGIGLFSGFVSLDVTGYKQPVLVSSVDGVGTKILIAKMMQRYDTIGVDLVNHCLNDIMVSGADPLFFMDYIAAARLEQACVAELVRGMAQACREAGCPLVAGETAEMPGVYERGGLDLVGAIVGLVERERIIDGSRIAAGDVLLGVPSSGLHTNGYSLVRKIFFEERGFDCSHQFEELSGPLGEELLRPHQSYQKLIAAVRERPELHGIAHITGGGIHGNVIRLLRNGLRPVIDWDAWKPAPIFELIRVLGGVEDEEMQAVFNMGIGLVLVVAASQAEAMAAGCASVGFEAFPIGTIVQG